MIEIPSIFSNVVSYARIMAVGLASIFLAILVNETVASMVQKGFLFALLGILLAIVGHAFNTALGIFSSFLHSIRLHYVEFFTKFYKGGGREYSPFGLKKEYGGE